MKEKSIQFTNQNLILANTRETVCTLLCSTWFNYFSMLHCKQNFFFVVLRLFIYFEKRILSVCCLLFAFLVCRARFRCHTHTQYIQ